MHACKLLERTMAISAQASACCRPLTHKETSMQDISDQHVRACFIRIMQRARDLRNVGKTHGEPLPPVMQTYLQRTFPADSVSSWCEVTSPLLCTLFADHIPSLRFPCEHASR